MRDKGKVNTIGSEVVRALGIGFLVRYSYLLQLAKKVKEWAVSGGLGVRSLDGAQTGGFLQEAVDLEAVTKKTPTRSIGY